MPEVREARILRIVPLLIAIYVFAVPARARYGGGTGEPNDPYLIYTPEQMNAIGAEPNDWDKHFKLMADIDLSVYKGTQFNTIGRWIAYASQDNKAFSGVFDGNWKVIRNFTWVSTEADAAGLFTYIESNRQGDTIRNLGLEDVDIRVENAMYVGALAAVAFGDIANCYVTGSVVGKGADEQTYRAGGVGGLAGWLRARTRCCYTHVTVTGDSQVGGLVGVISEKAGITDCYAGGHVIAGAGSEGLGGLVGRTDHRDDRWWAWVGRSFWDIETTGQTTSAGGTDKTTIQMKTAATFLDTGWDFVGETANGEEDIWWIREGQDYPRLSWETNRN